MKLSDELKQISRNQFLSGKAGSFSGVQQRTVQAWTEQKLIIPNADTTGTGKRRGYSVMNCIEIGIIKKLRDFGLPVKNIFITMKFITGRDDSRHRLKLLLKEDRGYLVVQIGTDKVITAPQCSVYGYSKGEKFDTNHWAKLTCPLTADSAHVININRLAKDILENIKGQFADIQ